VPPDADVVQQRDQADAELVEHAVQHQDRREQQDRVPVPGGAEVPLQVEQRVEEERGAEVDAGRDRDLAEEVEPAGEPGPRGPGCAARLLIGADHRALCGLVGHEASRRLWCA
jgi:hypothetical protein